ncbi:5-hydroxytryptamine receptor 1A [Paramuricea clavata]|uniref:5-hydroxytryptamine receptor 1A n=1 Tax=Paramuricea clavata TaxID=317549 RepID=A0A7D9HEY4_PARCT|nr:5-hydroxytryptamine receptor 1A [Paramuricea clavata]
MLLIAFIKDPLKCFRNSATYLVGNLALSDLLVNVVTMTNTFWVFENAVVVVLQYFSFYLSMLTIFSIALDRYLMITYPFKHRFLMSGKKMAIWIALIWFLSAVHLVKSIVIPKENDVTTVRGIVLALVLFTALLYGKTYFALRKQARSMIGKKTTFSSKQSRLDERAENQYERAEIENERAKSQSERDQSLDERAKNQNHLAGKQNDRSQNRYERAEIENERAESRNQLAQNKNDRVESQNERARREDLSSNKTPKNSQIMSNTREQKFLNTIIIIACIAVVTVMPGVIYGYLGGWVIASADKNRILPAVLVAIFCLNFAVNPFVYCLRLKRYRKTFKMVYGCQH